MSFYYTIIKREQFPPGKLLLLLFHCRNHDVIRVGSLRGSYLKIIDRLIEAFERLCDGKFNDGGFFEVERPNDVTVLSCELRYRIDTKGFYQPVYLFELASEDGSYMDWIMIPAMK